MKKLITLFILMVIGGSLNCQNLRENIPVEEKIQKLSILWKEIHYNFAFIDRLDFDLDSLYRESLKRVLKTKNNFELIGELSYFLEQLDDGHTAMRLPQHYWNQVDFPDVFTTNKNGKDYVTKIGRNYVEEIPLGSELIEIDGIPVKEARKKTFNAVLLGFKNSIVKLKFIRPDGKQVEKNILRNSNVLWREGKIDWVTSEGENNTMQPKHKPFKFYEKINNISVVTLNSFSNEAIVEEFRRYINKINSTSGLIIDVRKNNGGNSDYAIGITKHLVKEEYILTERWKTRTHNAAKKAWASINSYNPDNTYAIKYKEYFSTIQWETHLSDSVSIAPETKKISVPIVILTDRGTFSAAEDFLLYTNNDKTIKRIGRPSAGSSGQPLRINLFEHVHARICAKRDVMPDGTDYIGIGVKPHIEVNENQNALSVALDYLSKK